MSLSSFGYVGIRSDKLDDWASFGPDFLGLELVERTASSLKFRMDDRKQRIVVSREELPPHVLGWEVESEAALDQLAGRLEAAKVQVARVPRAEADMRGVASGIRFADPAGTPLEAFCGAEIADTPFASPRKIVGFRTGTLGMGHAVLHVKSIDDVQWFYQDVLGFRLSDYTLSPFKAFFFHINPRHHSLAMIETGKTGIHHLMMELYSMDDVGQTYDRAMAEPGRIGTSLGRHTNDRMMSFYANTPSDFLMEYGWGGLTIDEATWQPFEMKYGPSLWGHDRTWVSPEVLAEARKLRAKAAADGIREPVQVVDGNFEIGVGHCAWWDGLKKN